MATGTITDTLQGITLRAQSTTTLNGLEAVLSSLGLPVPIPGFNQADVLNKPLDIGRCYFAHYLSDGAQCDFTTAGRSTQLPSHIEDGDLATVLPKLRRGIDFNSLAFDIVKRWSLNPLFVPPFYVSGDAHLRINFAPNTLSRLILPYIEDRGLSYGFDKSLGSQSSAGRSCQKKLVIVFSSPNLAADFEGKHLRSTILGAHIAKLYENVGWDVVRLNYLGDWGKSLALLGVGWNRFGSEDQFAKRPIRHILDVKHKIDELFAPEVTESRQARGEGRLDDQAKIESEGIFRERNEFFARLESGGEMETEFWQKIRNASIRNYEKLYHRLNIAFDEFSGESSIKEETMKEVEDLMRRKGLTEDNGGALVIDLKKKAGMKSGFAIVRDRSGSSTYLLRDIAAVLDRYRNHDFDELIYVAASDHNDHFVRLKKILELLDMPQLAGKVRHISFSKASNIVDELDASNTLKAILDQCKSAVRMSMDYHPGQAAVLGSTDEIADRLAMNALIGNETSIRRATDQSFDESRLTSFEPDAALGVQYWDARLRSVLGGDSVDLDEPEVDDNLYGDDDQSTLLRLLVVWPEVVGTAYRTLEPAGIVAYLANLTSYLAACLEDIQTPLSSAKRALYTAVATVMRIAMSLLGMRAII